MGLFYAAILLGTGLLAWWLSGYDPRLTGENKTDDLSRRIIRTGLTVTADGRRPRCSGVGSKIRRRHGHYHRYSDGDAMAKLYQ